MLYRACCERGRGATRGVARLRRARLGAILGLLLASLPGCNLKPAPPGTLAADPDLEFMDPTVVMADIELGPGDQIAVSIYRHPDLAQSVEIPPDGVIFLPLVGEIDARGATMQSLRLRLTEAYAAYIVDPQVSLDVTVRRSQRVLVLGEVRSPGVFNLARPTTTLEVLASAGGFTQASDQGAVYLHRLEHGEPVQRVLDLDRMLNRGAIENNPLVQAGDILYVPPSEFAKIDRFARHVSTWMSPILLTQDAILKGQAIDRGLGDVGSGSSSIIIGVPTTTQ